MLLLLMLLPLLLLLLLMLLLLTELVASCRQAHSSAASWASDASETHRHDDRTSPAPDSCAPARCVLDSNLPYCCVAAQCSHPPPPPRWRANDDDIWKSINALSIETDNCVVTPRHSPAVLAKGEHIALILDAGHRIVISMTRCIHLVGAIVALATLIRVLGAIVPQQRHHHFAWERGEYYID